MQEIDAQRRLAILRGEVPPPVEDKRDDKSATIEERAGSSHRDHHGGTSRKRKRQGEDDTDFELRLAKERNKASSNALEASRKLTSSAPIIDRAGHTDLFGDERSRAHAEKNEEAEREAKKKKEREDPYKVRLSSAAGRDGISRPWYSQPDLAAVEVPSKNVWGREDPRRKEREAQRMVANDPLAMMKKGAAKVRELKQARNNFREEREEELRQLRKADRRRENERQREVKERRHRSRSPSRRSNQERRRSRSRDGRGHRDGDRKDRDERRYRDDGRSRRRESPSSDHRARRNRHD